MKMPTGKNKTLAIGGAVVGGVVIIMYLRKKKAASNTAAGGYDPNAIDPSTGLPYGQEAGLDPNTGLTYASETGLGYAYSGSAVNQGGTASSGLGGTYTTNTQWMNDALQAAQNYYGASYSLAGSALGKYIAQNPSGLTPNEYSIVSEVVAQIGQPPEHGPYRLIQSHDAPTPPPDNKTAPPTPTPTPTPSGGTGIPAGYHMQGAQFAELPGSMSLRQYWQKHYGSNQQALTNLIKYNPNIPVDWTAHMALSIKTSDAHLVPDF